MADSLYVLLVHNSLHCQRCCCYSFLVSCLVIAILGEADSLTVLLQGTFIEEPRPKALRDVQGNLQGDTGRDLRGRPSLEEDKEEPGK